MSRAAAIMTALLLGSLALLGLQAAFVGHSSAGPAALRQSIARSAGQTELPASVSGSEEFTPSASGALPFLAGLCLGVLLFVTSPGVARADVEDTVIKADDKGKTMTMTKEQLVRGKRLFNAACANCHVGGGTRTNQNVGLALEELKGASPSRDNVESIVNFLNSPMTYDGLYDISEVHCSIKSADLFPKMRSMKQQDLTDMSAYILYQNATIPEKWGGGKQYY
mmetsp:Transcript_67983/g.148080  ORF Transcript_67983/g.148080 Transcript_67983/m.148080 type:complete len:224 (-) Transcript_67983:73-744(-)